MAEDNKIYIKLLGAGTEVGRSCIHLKYRTKELLLDCGVHPAYNGISSLPFLDLIDLEKIDACLITHFHLDHAAALPFLTEKTNFKGKVYMTHPTKTIFKWLLNDFIRVINSSSAEDFYSETDLTNCYNKIIAIDYHQQVHINGIKFTALNAGHVLGAAMFLLEIEETKLLYTGDFSREDDRHLKAAESPNCKLDILITESTYGTQCHLPRAEREARFLKVVTDVVLRGGKCLLPVFALGRAQELLLILEEHWIENKKLKKIPIYYASALANRCMSVYQTYINMMNGRLQKISLTRNPFEFKYIQFIKDQNRFKDVGPCVIMASPGMLQSGFSRDLFESWCTNPKNGVVISGYSVEGTLAKEILKEPNEIQSLKGHLLKLNMTVEYISFSAHVDYTQNSEFIDECEPKHLFLIHGEATEMFRLKATISTRNEKLGKEMEVYALKNGDEVSIPIKKINKGIILTKKRKFTALIMQGDDINRIYDGDDIENKRVDCGLDVIKLVQKQTIPYNMTWNLIMDVLITEFGANINDEEELKLGGISISHNKDNVILRWEANYCDDVLALAIKKLVDEFGSGIKTLMWTHVKGLKEKVGFLKNYFDDVEIKETKIIVNKSIIIKNNKIYGEDGDLKERVIRVYNSINKVNHNH